MLTTKRGGNNPLTFQVYRDQSGFTYAHAGESTNAGVFLKLRYGLTDNTTLMLTALQNNQAIATLCTQFTGVVPCGIGPNNTSTAKYQFVYGTVQSLIGEVAVQVTGYIVDAERALEPDQPLHRSVRRATGRRVRSTNRSQPTRIRLTRGLAGQATISKDNHTITLNATTFAAQTTFNPLVSTGSSTLVTRRSTPCRRPRTG